MYHSELLQSMVTHAGQLYALLVVILDINGDIFSIFQKVNNWFINTPCETCDFFPNITQEKVRKTLYEQVQQLVQIMGIELMSLYPYDTIVQEIYVLHKNKYNNVSNSLMDILGIIFDN